MGEILAIIGLTLFGIGFIGVAAIAIKAAFAITPILGFLGILCVGIVIGIVSSQLD